MKRAYGILMGRKSLTRGISRDKKQERKERCFVLKKTTK